MMLRITGRKNCRRNNEEGFTLMELLIVMSLILILMALAIPGYRGIIRHTNELSAMRSITAVRGAEVQYHGYYPMNGYACSLSALGGSRESGAASPTAAQLLDDDLAAGQKSGYTFAIVNCGKVTINNQDQYTSFEITAVPQDKGKTGDRGFCATEDGAIKYDPLGGTNCTLAAQ